MENQASPLTAENTPAAQDSVRRQCNSVMTTIPFAALGTFCIGAVFDAAWPGAVASCGISFMGAVIAYFVLRDSSCR